MRGFGKSGQIAMTGVALALACSAAYAQEAPVEPVPTEQAVASALPDQHGFAVGVQAGGVGVEADARVGSSTYGVHLGAALSPGILYFRDGDAATGTTRYEFHAAGDFRVDGYAYFITTARARLGLIGGGNYNTLFGLGFNLGGGAVIAVWPHVDLQLMWTVAIFPGAEDSLRKHGILAASGSSSIVPWLQGTGAAVGFLFHP